MTRTSRNVTVGLIVTLGLAGVGWTVSADQVQSLTLPEADAAQARLTNEIAGEDDTRSEVLDWNQIFIDTLIATNTANSVESTARGDRSHGDLRCVQRHRKRYTPIFVRTAPPRARRAARRSSLRRTQRWSACSRPNKRRSMPTMRLRSRR